MKIQITNEGDEGFFIYKTGENRPVKNYRSNFTKLFTFWNQDILWLIGEKNYDNKFLKGVYTFSVTANHLKLITGERSAQNRKELAMYNK